MRSKTKGDTVFRRDIWRPYKKEKKRKQLFRAGTQFTIYILYYIITYYFVHAYHIIISYNIIARDVRTRLCALKLFV